LDRAIHARGADTYYEQQARTLEAFSFRKAPSVRAETGASSADDLNLITNNVTRVDAFTALITVDYPLLDGGLAGRSLAAARADAQLTRARAEDEADAIFRETLDAYARLYLADARLSLLQSTIDRASDLRERSKAMLAAGRISNTVAAQWEDQALAAESMLVDLQLQRLDAETRLKQLIGDTSSEPIELPEQLENIAPRPTVDRAKLEEDRRRIALQDALATRKPQLMMSAFGGVANVTEGTFGLYGVRFTLSLPMFDGNVARRIARSRIEADDAARARSLLETTQHNRIDLLHLSVNAADRRISLLSQAVDVAKQREESIARLVRAGDRPEGDLVDVATDISRREGDQLAVRVERWKLEQQLRWGR
jgi:outer membrane protein TolC